MATLLEKWHKKAYAQDQDRGQLQRFWTEYFEIEKGIYTQLLTEPDVKVSGTVKELADKFAVSVMEMTGFLDGINDSLTESNPIETMAESTTVHLDYDPEKLYKNMVGAQAEWLYELPQWEAIIPEDRRKELYKEQKASGTIRKEKKVGRNEPCPCGSGKKYKMCCGR